MSNLTSEQRCVSLIKQMQLPEYFQSIVVDIYRPLANIIVEKAGDVPLLVSVNGLQGTGKSTMTAFIKQIIEAESQAKVVVLSLDDFYSTHNDRAKLSSEVHPLLKTRGVPGTHDVVLLERTLDALNKREMCKVPSFDKVTDDRRKELLLINKHGDVDIILFEGWCNNSPVQSEDELVLPVNALEKQEDKDCVWRYYVNQQLFDYHKRIFDRTNLSIMLKAPSFDCVYQWRSLQEKKLKADNSNNKNTSVMDSVQLNRFIQHFERISRHSLSYLPEKTDVVLPLTKDHLVAELIVK